MKSISLLVLFSLCLYACFQKDDDLKEEAEAYYRAIQFRDKGSSDSAFIYFNKAKEEFQLNGNTFSVGKCLVNMAILSTEQGDYFGGQELSIEALNNLNEENPKHHIYLRSNLNNLGVASFKLKDYNQAVNFYSKSLAFVKDTASKFVVMNNMASSYREAKAYNAALDIYRRILKNETNAPNYAMALAGYALTRWLQDSSFKPLPGFYKALDLRVRHDDRWGLNASYAFLSDYYMKTQPDSALYYAKMMYDVAASLASADDRLAALQKLSRVSQPEKAKAYFMEYQRLSDSLQTKRSAAKNQFALIRYQTEKYKADKLRLQKEKAIQNIWISSLIMLIIAGCVWYQKRRERLKLENLNAIKESQLKTSKKVHDVVANGLYRLMFKIDNTAGLDKDIIVDEIECLYEQSRDIAHEDEASSVTWSLYNEKISNLLQDFNTKEIQLRIIDNTEEFWDGIDHKCKGELEKVIQELMVNMQKHSQATQVAIRFERKGDLCKIHYLDNGIGLNRLEKSDGRGLRNTENRMIDINGAITFDKATGGGLKVTLSFPAD